MKTRCVVLILFCLLVPLSFAETVIVRVLVPVDIGGNTSYALQSGPGGLDWGATNAGIGLGAELLFPLGRHFQLGVGGNFEFARGFANYAGTFGFDPLYAVARVVFPLRWLSPYIIGRVGYNSFNGDSNFAPPDVTLGGGFCYSIGAGLDVTLLRSKRSRMWAFIEGNYAGNVGQYNIAGFPGFVTYNRFQLDVGVAFGF
jgi:hypothetical protein